MGCGASSSKNAVHPLGGTDSPPLSLPELQELMASGAGGELQTLRRLAFERGLAPVARAEAWPILLGVHPPGPSAADRAVGNEALWSEYESLRTQGEALANSPDFRDGTVIVHDVARTQVQHPLYEAHKKDMTDILFAFAAFDPEVGYGQGMSDMLTVLLFSLREPWLTFWCFAALFRVATPEAQLAPVGLRGDDMRRLHLASAVTDAADGVLNRLLMILQRRVPKLYSFFVANDCGACLFCYAWVKMLLKRELPFEQVARLWEGVWGSVAVLQDHPRAAEDLVLYCCAVLLKRKQPMLLKAKGGLAGVMMCLKEEEVLACNAPVLLQEAVVMARKEKHLHRLGLLVPQGDTMRARPVRL